MWIKESNKLKMAAEMVSAVIPQLEGRQVILSFDSWYAKKTFIQPLQGFENLVMICNARYDSALFDLPPAPTGKRGFLEERWLQGYGIFSLAPIRYAVEYRGGIL
jgi:hypothetical protein